jgi:glycosyltransferase involved in cell wall biosynthesis
MNPLSNHELAEQLKALASRVKTLEERLESAEEKFESAARAYGRARFSARRIWLRPPLWTFEQYSPRPLAVKSSYAQTQVPDNPPSFLIGTPSFNHRKYVGLTIDSVLSQDYPRLTYHVQDANSTDGTQQLLADYGSRISWRSERDDGQAQGINRAFAGATGDIMSYLNSDDVLLPGTLRYVARIFHDRPDIDLIYGHRIFIDREGLEVGRAVLPAHDANALYWADYVPQETLFWRRRVWDAIGPFDETFHYALDWDFILRAQAAGFKFYRAPRFLACFRVHDEQKTAALYETGRREMQRLRKRYLKHEPQHHEILRRMAPYLTRQVFMHWSYRLGILRP